MIRQLAVLFAFAFLNLPLIGQQTVGVNINDEGATEGYTFFSPLSNRSAYLVDNCGFLVNQWDRQWTPGRRL